MLVEGKFLTNRLPAKATGRNRSDESVRGVARDVRCTDCYSAGTTAHADTTVRRITAF